jgi:hypothetical protein
MNQQKLLKSANIGIFIGLLVATLSFLFSLVPCKKEAGIGVCQLPNPFSDLQLPLNQNYYFISNNPMTGLILQFLIPIIIVLLITIRSITKAPKKEKLVDYTKK